MRAVVVFFLITMATGCYMSPTKHIPLPRALQSKLDPDLYASRVKKRDERLAKAREDILAAVASIMGPVEGIQGGPREVEVPAADIGSAWSRANVFIAQHASMKIQVTSDFVVETYNPEATSRRGVGYRALKRQDGERFLVTIECWGFAPDVPQSGLPRAEFDAKIERNSIIAAHYVRTGEMVCETCLLK